MYVTDGTTIKKSTDDGDNLGSAVTTGSLQLIITLQVLQQ